MTLWLLDTPIVQAMQEFEVKEIQVIKKLIKPTKKSKIKRERARLKRKKKNKTQKRNRTR